MVYKRYGGSGKFTPQQLVIMDKQNKVNNILRKESEKISERKEVKNKVSITISDNKSYEIIQYTSHTVHVWLNGEYVGDRNNKKHLREIAEYVNINIFNGNGNQKNTRTIGDDIIKYLKAAE
ncbi:hypothetical protein [Schinkia azotoformans]|uniref:hypothetical protein n=1 Tax=Schinkia azotoformans TaxID=1454 RepID=UPI002DBE97B1|nr:hypothetical protein [Schinkia azotoformans]MEC1697749.1 hypothetical protein [Schinkia azotoformans]